MRNRMLSALTLITLTAVPLYAHRLALKNGDTLQFENYQVSESTLFYTSADGKQIAIPLTNVDLDRTQQLNANETVPLDLPGIILPSSHGTDGAQSSLGGDCASAKEKHNRRQREKSIHGRRRGPQFPAGADRAHCANCTRCCSSGRQADATGVRAKDRGHSCEQNTNTIG